MDDKLEKDTISITTLVKDTIINLTKVSTGENMNNNHLLDHPNFRLDGGHRTKEALGPPVKILKDTCLSMIALVQECNMNPANSKILVSWKES